MRIHITETTIEANARELRESNTLASNFAMMLSRCFQSNESFDDGQEEDETDNDCAGAERREDG